LRINVAFKAPEVWLYGALKIHNPQPAETTAIRQGSNPLLL